MKKKIAAAVILVIIALAAGSIYGIGNRNKAAAVNFGTAVDANRVKYDRKLPEAPLEESEKEAAREKGPADQLLSEMTLQEKVGQLFYLELDALSGQSAVTAFSGDMAAVLEYFKPGGIILFKNNIRTSDQVKALNQQLQEHTSQPLFIGVDEEGGMVQRISNNEQIYQDAIAPMAEIGASGDPGQAYQTGVKLAERLSDLGFNMDFAPVADVLTNKDNSEIGSRSFGSDPELVAQMAVQTVKGMQEHQVSAAMKHFPGHGDARTNSHYGYAETARTLDEMRSCEFLPFQAGIEEGVDFILVSHISAVNITEEKQPSSLSQEVITGLLREELQYDGIIITDALNMGAVSNSWNSGAAAVKALQAGADMLLMPADPRAAYDEVIRAVEAGEISEARIDESVKRILAVKYKNELFTQS